jgi:hypothetical protein
MSLAKSIVRCASASLIEQVHIFITNAGEARIAKKAKET